MLKPVSRRLRQALVSAPLEHRPHCASQAGDAPLPRVQAASREPHGVDPRAPAPHKELLAGLVGPPLLKAFFWKHS